MSQPVFLLRVSQFTSASRNRTTSPVDCLAPLAGFSSKLVYGVFAMILTGAHSQYQMHVKLNPFRDVSANNWTDLGILAVHEAQKAPITAYSCRIWDQGITGYIRCPADGRPLEERAGPIRLRSTGRLRRPGGIDLPARLRPLRSWTRRRC